MPRLLLVPFLLMSLVFAGCGTDAGTTASSDASLEGMSIPKLAGETEELSTLVEAIIATELLETLEGEGPFTVFAPTNEAFGKLPESLLEELLDDPDALRDILLYHVVAEELFAADVLSREKLTTVLGPPITVQPEGPTLNETVGLVATDIVAKNGVVHLIDMVLIPPTDDDGDDDDEDSDDEDSDDGDDDEDSDGSDDEDSDDGDDDGDDDEDSDDEDEADHDQMTILEIAKSDDRFETLVAAVKLTGLDETLAGEGPFTVFAPTDEAFDALPDGLLHELIENPENLKDILLYHVVAEELFAEDVVAREALTSVLGPEITVQAEALTLNEESKLIILDIVAKNGVIHVIDKVLIPPPPEPEPKPILETLSEDERFTTLVEAVQAAHLVEALEGEGPFTVFAPTNEAFDRVPKLLRKLLFLSPTSLRNVLLYHVVPGDLFAEDVLAAEALETLLGPTIHVDGENATLNGHVNIIEVDIVATNGVIHVIDAVLIPPLH